MHIFTINAREYKEDDINKVELQQLINKHKSIVTQMAKNKRYYNGKHAILSRQKKLKTSSNNKVVCNHAKDISDTATGYFMGSPISYSAHEEKGKESVAKLTDAFDKASIDGVDGENAHDMSVCGVAYEYIYPKEGTTELTVRNLEAENTFLVYDDTIEQNLLYGVYYYRFKDAIKDTYCFRATVLTKNYKHEYVLECNSEKHIEISTNVAHHMGDVPIVEYRNNKHCIGDFEQQISLIDAYNTVMSDRVNDKEQFVESLLTIYGALLGDDNEEVSETMKILKENGILELPADAKAEYISRVFDEAGMEVLRKAIKEDIYTFSHVPNLTDENFVGNSSGVAMEYKLLGLEMITKEKEKYYRMGLLRRIQLFSNYMNLKAAGINPNLVKINFSRSLPKNTLELAQMISNLKGVVSQETLISQLSFVEDAPGEIEKVKAENEENMKRQQSLFKDGYNKPFNDKEPQIKEEDDE